MLMQLLPVVVLASLMQTAFATTCATCSLGNLGAVHFRQTDKLEAHFYLHNLVANGGYKMHVHINGDTTMNCANIGGHYDPADENNDVGDLAPGGVNANPGGMIHSSSFFNVPDLSLGGTNDILTRSVALHHGSSKVCCTIESSSCDFHNHS